MKRSDWRGSTKTTERSSGVHHTFGSESVFRCAALTDDEGEEDEPSEPAHSGDDHPGIAEGEEEHAEVDPNMNVVLELVQRRELVVRVAFRIVHLHLHGRVHFVPDNGVGHAGPDRRARRRRALHRIRRRLLEPLRLGWSKGRGVLRLR